MVKNVTGYDLGKLYTGSMGTLGVIIEATFKLNPLPQRLQALTAGFQSVASAIEAATDCPGRYTRPRGFRLLMVSYGEGCPQPCTTQAGKVLRPTIPHRERLCWWPLFQGGCGRWNGGCPMVLIFCGLMGHRRRRNWTKEGAGDCLNGSQTWGGREIPGLAWS